MDFGLSDSQLLLQRSVADFLNRSAPIERVRKVVDGGTGCDRQLFKELGDQGITGLLIDEAAGGSAAGLLDAVVAAQELGRHASPCSFHSACVAAPLLLTGCGTVEGPSRDWLPKIAGGSALLSVILDGPEISNGVLEGTMLYVPDADTCDAILVRTGDELHLLLQGHRGVEIEALQTVDATRRVGEVRFAGVRVNDSTRVAASAELPDLARQAEQAAQVALAADTLGACQKALAMAVEYSLEREQFGRVIGSFQAVKHMCAETVAAIDPIQSLLWYTAFTWDKQSTEAASLAPLLKSHAADVGYQAVTTTTQVMGGIGFTHECDMHLFYKRVGFNRQMFGGASNLRAQAAELRYGASGRGAAPSDSKEARR